MYYNPYEVQMPWGISPASGRIDLIICCYCNGRKALKIDYGFFMFFLTYNSLKFITQAADYIMI